MRKVANAFGVSRATISIIVRRVIHILRSQVAAPLTERDAEENGEKLHMEYHNVKVLLIWDTLYNPQLRMSRIPMKVKAKE